MGKQEFPKDSSRDSTRKPLPPKKIFYVYETVAKIITKALNQEGTLRSLVYEHAKTLVKTHLRLAIDVVRHRTLLEKLVSGTGLAEKEQLEPELAQVLVYELLLGERKQLPQGLDIFDRVVEHRERLDKALRKLQKSGDVQQLVVDKPEATVPRYGRVNTLVTSLEAVVQNIQRRGFRLIDLEGKSYEEFLDCVRGLQEKEFVLDFHFPKDLLVFNPRQFLADLFVHKSGHLVVQDKTSYFPVACLGAPPGSTVLDACAAPGMKTVHIAAKMNNQGLLLALDNNVTGMKRLESSLNMFGVQCCQSSFSNFLSADPRQEPFNSVEYIVLDVPCSHSGNRSADMQAAHVDRSYSADRLRALSGLQFRMLCHALKFPKVKRIVYTTTSNEDQENEQVIQDALSKNPENFKLAKAFREWHIRGNPEFPFGEFCVRTRPHEDCTIGSFVAVLERIRNGPERLESFSASSTDLIKKLPFEAYLDRVGERRVQKTGEEQESPSWGKVEEPKKFEGDESTEAQEYYSVKADVKTAPKTKKKKGHKFRDDKERLTEHDFDGAKEKSAKMEEEREISTTPEERIREKKPKKKRDRRNDDEETFHSDQNRASFEDEEITEKTTTQMTGNETGSSDKKSKKRRKKRSSDCESNEVEHQKSKKKRDVKEPATHSAEVGGISIFSMPKKKKW